MGAQASCAVLQVAMATNNLKFELSLVGLWLGSVVKYVRHRDLETTDDSRCILADAEEAADEGGILLKLAW